MRARLLPDESEVIAKDETVLWEGRPLVVGLTRRLFHIRAVMGYFAVIAAWNLASAHADGLRANAAMIGTAYVALAAIGLAAVITAMAWVFAITTRYTITDRRVIMQVGTALPIALTLPLHRIGSADVRLYPDGSGDIPLALGDQKVAYLLVWPHARPWHFRSPQPMLRCVPDARSVATILSRALLTASPSGEMIAVAPAPDHAAHGEPVGAAA